MRRSSVNAIEIETAYRIAGIGTAMVTAFPTAKTGARTIPEFTERLNSTRRD
jgi:hypothetical protein